MKEKEDLRLNLLFRDQINSEEQDEVVKFHVTGRKVFDIPL